MSDWTQAVGVLVGVVAFFITLRIADWRGWLR
jgi:hypothetical protein